MVPLKVFVKLLISGNITLIPNFITLSYYPIILIPQALQKVKTAQPPLPKFREKLPRSPQPPQPIEFKLICLEVLGLTTLVLPLGFLNGLIAAGLMGLGFIAIALQTWLLKNNFPRRYQSYEVALAAYPAKLENFRQLQWQHQQHIQTLQSPDYIQEFRQRLLLEILGHTKPQDGNNSKARRGISEAKFGRHLRRYFGDNIHERLYLNIPNFPEPYSPDFAYIDRGLKLYIDIEIDEPYTNRQPIHFIGKDERRNQFFLERGWLVIRFCEEQVIRYPRQCCKVIAQVIADILGDELELSRFKDTPDLPKIKLWTYKEALQMIRNQARDRYQS